MIRLRSFLAPCVLALLAPLSTAFQVAPDVHLVIANAVGEVIPDAPVSYVDANGETQKAQPMPDGSSMIYGAPTKLILNVEDPETGAANLELMLSSQPLQEFMVRVDGAGGVAKVTPMVVPRPRRIPANVVFVPTGLGTLTPVVAGSMASSFTPSNDDCADATPISGDGSFLYDTLHATTDGSEHAACDEFGSAGISNDIWFCWTASCTGEATVENCFAVGDSRIAVYDGCACPATDAALLACNDDACGLFGFQSRVTFPVVQGQQYLIRIGSYPNAFIQATAGVIEISCFGAPANDECDDAEYIGVPSSTMGSTANAGVDDVEFCGTAASTSPGVWYRLTGTGRELTAETCNWADFDTKISVFCRGCEEPVCVTGNDDDCPGFLSSVTWCSQEDAEYLILVHGFGGASGDFQLDVHESGDYCEPDVRCIFEGACCEGGECQVLTEHECDDDGGVFFGDLTDCCGSGIYEEQECYDDFEDISYSGYELSLGDDEGEEVPLGFGFDFFGETYFHVSVSSNGYLTFGSDDDSNSPEEIPNQNDPDALIAPYWTDWNPNENGRIHYEVLGSPGDRRFIAQWTEIAHFDVGGGESTFQAVLYEADGTISFRYGQLDSSAMSFSYAVGIENAFGSHGYGMFSGGIYSGDCIRYAPVMAPYCDSAKPVMIDYEVYFSDLDGSYLDTDGESDGRFKTNGMVLGCGGVILVDVDYAEFEAHGDVIIRDCAAIRNPSFPLYHTGPSIYINACGNVKLLGDARIRSEGEWCGGSIDICTGKSFVMDGVVANIEAVAAQSYGGKGGWVDIEARRRIDIGPFHPYITVKGEEAGHIHLTSCDGGDRAIEIEGRLIAKGWGPYGRGGEVGVYARQGGIWLPSLDKIVADGQQSDGTIELVAGTVYGPVGGPNTTPAASLYTWSPDFAPCDCLDD